MNQKTVAIAAVLIAAVLTGISATTTFAYAEYDDCEVSIESRTTVCEGNGIETTYSAMPMDDDATAEETMDTSFLADDPTDAMGSALKTLTTQKTKLQMRLTKRKTQLTMPKTMLTK